MALVAKFVPFNASKVAATYGTGTYGGDGTYGQEASDPLTNTDYVLAPSPGSWPSSMGWEFRTGDTCEPGHEQEQHDHDRCGHDCVSGVEFAATVLGIDGPLALGSFAQAVLVIERISMGPRVCKGFGCALDATNRRITYAWRTGDLDEPGLYRVSVQLVSLSGRPLTIDANDYATMIVREGS